MYHLLAARPREGVLDEDVVGRGEVERDALLGVPGVCVCVLYGYGGEVTDAGAHADARRSTQNTGLGTKSRTRSQVRVCQCVCVSRAKLGSGADPVQDIASSASHSRRSVGSARQVGAHPTAVLKNTQSAALRAPS